MNFDIRRVIAGKRYDTEKAKFVMPLPPTQSGDREVNGLFKSRGGTFFVAGFGGAASQWARRSGMYRYEGEGIKLLTDAEAQNLMETHDGPVEDYFEVEDD